MHEILTSRYFDLKGVKLALKELESNSFGRWESVSSELGDSRKRSWEDISRASLESFELPNFVSFFEVIGHYERGAGDVRRALEWDGEALSQPYQTRRLVVSYTGASQERCTLIMSHDYYDDPVGYLLFRSAAKDARPPDSTAEIEALSLLGLRHQLNYLPDGRRFSVSLLDFGSITSKDLYLSEGVNRAGFDVDGDVLKSIWSTIFKHLSNSVSGVEILDISYWVQVGNVWKDDENVREKVLPVLERLPTEGVFTSMDLSYTCRVPKQGWLERESDRKKGNSECDEVGVLKMKDGIEVTVSLAYDDKGYRIFLDPIPSSLPSKLVKKYDFDH